MKVTLVYTSAAPELIELVEKEMGDILPRETEMASYQDPSILTGVRDAGYVTAPLVVRLVGIYMTTASEGTDTVLDLCFFVGEVADATQDITKYTGIPIMCVNEEMCREAMRQGKRVGVVVTLPTMLNPTKDTILRVAREVNHRVELMDALVDGGFGLDQEQLKDLANEYTGTVTDKVDVILFAQDSMAYCEECTHEKYNEVVLSSPRFGTVALKDALTKKGLM